MMVTEKQLWENIHLEKAHLICTISNYSHTSETGLNAPIVLFHKLKFKIFEPRSHWSNYLDNQNERFQRQTTQDISAHHSHI